MAWRRRWSRDNGLHFEPDHLHVRPTLFVHRMNAEVFPHGLIRKRVPSVDGQSVGVGKLGCPHPSLELIEAVVSHVLGDQLDPHRREATSGQPRLVVLDAVEMPRGL